MAKGDALQSCSTEGHQGEPAAGVVVLADCEPEGSCCGHAYCATCIDVLTKDDPYNNLVEDWRPTPAEVPEIFYVDGARESQALCALAERFLADENMVLIGLWAMDPLDSHPGGVRLQVVVTHMQEAS